MGQPVTASRNTTTESNGLLVGWFFNPYKEVPLKSPWALRVAEKAPATFSKKRSALMVRLNGVGYWGVPLAACPGRTAWVRFKAWTWDF
jgi:hypothetical protein